MLFKKVWIWMCVMSVVFVLEIILGISDNKIHTVSLETSVSRLFEKPAHPQVDGHYHNQDRCLHYVM